ncbi:MAG: hypothetical protein U0841_29370 [Chloroflexia bacterium]
MQLVIALGVAQVIDERAAEYGWPYDKSGQLRKWLTEGLCLLLPGSSDPAKANTPPNRFAAQYKMLTEGKIGPYPGCQECPAICLFRAEVGRMLTVSDAQRITDAINDALKTASTTSLARYQRPLDIVRETDARWLATAPADDSGLNYCGLLTAAAGKLEQHQQAKVAYELGTFFQE